MRLWKVLLFIFLLLSIHESCHILCAKWLNLRSVEVKVYPMGLSARIKDLEFQKSIHELMITLSGLGVHIVAYYVLLVCVKMNLLSYSFAQYLNHINMSIFFFNLLPIYPLDGGRIIHNLLELVFPYQMAKKITIILSIGTIILMLNRGLCKSASGIILLIFLVFQLFNMIYCYTSDNQAFYLYRYLHGFNGRKKVHDRKDIYKNYDNYVYDNHRIIHEKQFLERFF